MEESGEPPTTKPLCKPVCPQLQLHVLGSFQIKPCSLPSVLPPHPPQLLPSSSNSKEMVTLRSQTKPGQLYRFGLMALAESAYRTQEINSMFWESSKHLSMNPCWATVLGSVLYPLTLYYLRMILLPRRIIKPSGSVSPKNNVQIRSMQGPS